MAWCYTNVRFSPQDAVSKLRGIGNGYSSRNAGESYESLQSKARELEKKVCSMVMNECLSVTMCVYM